MGFLRVIYWWTKRKVDNLVFKDKSQIYNIYLGKETYEQMIGYCSKANPYETGGVLIGSYSYNQTIADILQITPPPKNSKRSKYNFYRGSSGLKEILDIVWNQGLYYLGEWHYHPNASVVPSHTDLKQMFALSNNNDLKCPEPILIIIGGNEKDWKISAGVFSNRRYVCLELVK